MGKKSPPKYIFNCPWGAFVHLTSRSPSSPSKIHYRGWQLGESWGSGEGEVGRDGRSVGKMNIGSCLPALERKRTRGIKFRGRREGQMKAKPQQKERK